MYQSSTLTTAGFSPWSNGQRSAFFERRVGALGTVHQRGDLGHLRRGEGVGGLLLAGITVTRLPCGGVALKLTQWMRQSLPPTETQAERPAASTMTGRRRLTLAIPRVLALSRGRADNITANEASA